MMNIKKLQVNQGFSKASAAWPQMRMSRWVFKAFIQDRVSFIFCWVWTPHFTLLLLPSVWAGVLLSQHQPGPRLSTTTRLKCCRSAFNGFLWAWTFSFSPDLSTLPPPQSITEFISRFYFFVFKIFKEVCTILQPWSSSTRPRPIKQRGSVLFQLSPRNCGISCPLMFGWAAHELFLCPMGASRVVEMAC